MTGAARADEGRAIATAELDRLVRRLQGLSARAWEPRRAQVRDAVQRLADLGRRDEGLPPLDVPDLPDHALADAVAVVGADAIEAAGSSYDEVLAVLRAVLGAAG